jgi:hypothetical protein
MASSTTSNTSTSSARTFIRRTAIEAAIAAALALVISIVVFGPIMSLFNSGWSGGDMLSTYVNAENWSGFSYRDTTQFGFPLGMNLNYFPGIDITENVFAQVVTNITGQPFIGVNLLIFISFPLVAALAYLVIRMTGLKGALAIGLAVAFTFIPYHWGRALGHTYLSTLYSAVIGVALVLLVGSGTLERLIKTGSKRRRLLLAAIVAVMVVIVAWTGIYYAVFTLILGAAALLWRLAHRASIKALALDAAPFAGIGVLAVIGFIPALLTLRADPPLASLGERMAYESVTYAGNLAMAIVPLPQSSIPGLSGYNDRVLASIAQAPFGESNVITNHGTWITAAALLTIVIALIWRTRRRALQPSVTVDNSPITLAFIGYLTIVTTLFFVPWGLNYLFADVVTAQIRAWNRLLPVLLLLFILGAAVVLRNTPIARRFVIAVPVALVILGLVALDSVLPFRGAYRASASYAGEVTGAAREYATAVNTAIPANCGVLQLPYMAYPEFGVLRGINDYDHFWTSITNTGKQWSYGSVKNTDASIWAAQLPQVPTETQAALLEQGGFCAIHLDTRGYISEQLGPIRADLAARFGAPVATGFKDQWELYALPAAASTAGDATNFFHQARIAEDPGTVSSRDSLLGNSWWWTKEPTATFTVTPTREESPLTTISGTITAPSCGPLPVTVTLSAGDNETSTTVVADSAQPVAFELTLPTSTTEQATLTVDAPGKGCQVAGAGTQFAQVADLVTRS